MQRRRRVTNEATGRSRVSDDYISTSVTVFGGSMRSKLDKPATAANNMAAGTRYDGGTKFTFLHVTMQEYNEHNHHFLVPRLSDQALNDPVRVSAEGLSPTPGSSPPVKLGAQQRMTNTVYLADKSQQRQSSKQRQPRQQQSSTTPSVSIGFSAAMRPAGYAECVSVTDAPPLKETSVVTFCDFFVDARFKSAINIGPGLSPAWFQSKVVCHGTTSKKNFRNAIDYVPKMKPLKFEETHYVRPKHLETSYVSCYDYNADGSQKWFTTSVELVPATNSSNTVHNFQMRQRTVSSVSSSSSSSSDEGRANGDDVFGEDINQNVVNKNDRVHYQPPMLISSGPEDNDELRFGSTRLSHRTKMVVGEAPAQRMSHEDYVVYLQGYASTGDVIKHGYVKNGDVINGYLSDDISEV